MKYSAEDLKKLHETELEILREIIRICDDNNIRYFTIAGTTLGLIRHGGFIPWDDDIDLGMMRSDFNRFLEIAPRELKKGYTLQHYFTDPKTPTYHAKVRKDNTIFLEQSMRQLNVHKGIFVDIAPFDYVPDDEKERNSFLKKNNLATKLFTVKCFVYKPTLQDSFVKHIKFFFKWFIHICFLAVPKKVIFNKIDKLSQTYNSSPTNNICTIGAMNDYYLYNDVFPLVKRSFEGIEVLSPNNADAVLTQKFGNWRELPPEDKRYAHCPVELKF